MFLSIGVMGNFLGNCFYMPEYMRLQRTGQCRGFNDDGKNERCACPDIAGIQLELEEQARRLEVLLVVAHTAKMAYGTR